MLGELSAPIQIRALPDRDPPSILEISSAGCEGSGIYGSTPTKEATCGVSRNRAF